MKIRKMQMQDYHEVYSLWLSCSGIGLNNLDDSEKGIAKFLQRNPDTCFVAVDKNRIIGVIMAGSDGRRGYIYHTAVHPDYRNHGIAKQMVDKVMTALQNIGINKVALVVFNHNETGNHFWEKLGFTVRDDLIYRNKALTEIEKINT